MLAVLSPFLVRLAINSVPITRAVSFEEIAPNTHKERRQLLFGSRDLDIRKVLLTVEGDNIKIVMEGFNYLVVISC